MTALGEALDDAVLYVRRYYAYPDQETAWVHVLFAAYTWRYWHFRHQPRLVIDSPEWGSGKTTLGEDVLGGICCGLEYSENTTAASTFRSCADADVVTIGLDEMDALWAKGASADRRADLLEVIRNGYRTTGIVKRVGDTGRVERYPVGKPMMLVGNAFWQLLEGAARSRCIRTTVLRADTRAAGLGRVGSETFETERAMSRDTLSAAMAAAALERFPDVPYADRMADRTRDIWEPIVSVAMAAGGPWPERVTACIAIFAGVDDESERQQPKAIVTDTHKVCQESPLLGRASNPYGVAVSTLRTALVQLGRPWDGTGFNGEPITDERLRELLRRYLVKPAKVHGGLMRLRWADLERMWERYQGDSPASPGSPSQVSGPQQAAADDTGETAASPEQEAAVTPAAGFGGYGAPAGDIGPRTCTKCGEPLRPVLVRLGYLTHGEAA